MSRLTTYLHDLRTLPGDALLAHRRDGMNGAWQAVAGRSLHRLVQCGRLLIFSQSLNQRVDVEVPAGVRITRAVAADWPALGRLVGQREVERFGLLLARGRSCLIAWRDGKPVGYAWVAGQMGPDVSLWPLPVDVPAGTAYFWNLYVVPRERSSGLGSALAAERLRLAQEAGYREGWRMVAPSNGPSLRTVQKTATGTRLVGEIRFLQLLGCTYARFIPPSAVSR
jgi:ribosomal protein S18 acetylase RimI-like enzyme